MPQSRPRLKVEPPATERHWVVRCQADGQCILKADDDEATQAFPGIGEAVWVARQLSPDGKASLSVADAGGEMVFEVAV